MNRLNRVVRYGLGVLCAGALAAAVVSCDTMPVKQETPKMDKPAATTAATRAVAAVTPTARPTIRIKAGLDTDLIDSKGVKWSADTAYITDGQTIDRPDLVVTGTTQPELFKSEHYSMTAANIKVPNGAYIVKLYFSEDYDNIGGIDNRVFTYAVIDGTAASGKTIKEVKDFGPWRKTGAQFKAYVDEVPIVVTNGQITIKFTPQVENPQINAIEVLPG